MLRRGQFLYLWLFTFFWLFNVYVMKFFLSCPEPWITQKKGEQTNILNNRKQFKPILFMWYWFIGLALPWMWLLTELVPNDKWNVYLHSSRLFSAKTALSVIPLFSFLFVSVSIEFMWRICTSVAKNRKLHVTSSEMLVWSVF